MIRLILVDDHVLVREGFKRLLESVEDIQVMAETANGLELINLLYAQTFDLILMDISMPGVDSYELAQRISSNPQHPPILILSMHQENLIAKRMFKLGAKGYITKCSNYEELVTAIRIVANGGKYIGSKLSEQLFFEENNPNAQSLDHVLTSRQLDILSLLVKGKKGTEIATQLGLSFKTVSTHKTMIKQKLKIQSDADLIRYALSNNIV